MFRAWILPPSIRLFVAFTHCPVYEDLRRTSLTAFETFFDHEKLGTDNICDLTIQVSSLTWLSTILRIISRHIDRGDLDADNWWILRSQPVIIGYVSTTFWVLSTARQLFDGDTDVARRYIRA
ncbi:Hypothetical protein D9617_45g091330 [Elsinoe fawcettii]|nr:Hypothetical protein D9617_45g091330 [Elsinoe fawcettii]